MITCVCVLIPWADLELDIRNNKVNRYSYKASQGLKALPDIPYFNVYDCKFLLHD